MTTGRGRGAIKATVQGVVLLAALASAAARVEAGFVEVAATAPPTKSVFPAPGSQVYDGPGKMYTHEWSSKVYDVLQRLVPEVPQDRPVVAFEIGCFEGRTTNLLVEYFASSHPASRVFCFDVWEDGFVEDKAPIYVDQLQRFFTNTHAHRKQIVAIRGSSQETLYYIHPQLLADFIYIDGDHHKDAVYQDAILAWPHLRVGGTLLFDDYGGGDPAFPDFFPSIGIDRFLNEFEGQYRIVQWAYQVAIVRTQ